MESRKSFGKSGNFKIVREILKCIGKACRGEIKNDAKFIILSWKKIIKFILWAEKKINKCIKWSQKKIQKFETRSYEKVVNFDKESRK